MIRGSKAVLLDVDGVVFNHPRVMTRVVHRVTQYVHDHIPGVKNILEASDINQMLYKTFGHTHLGIQKVIGADAPNLAHFNQTVYDQSLVDYLHVFKTHHDVMDRREELQKFLIACAHMGVPCYLFSNAPDVWCNTVYEVMELQNIMPKENILCSSHEVFEGSLLKPQTRVYENVKDHVKASELVMVDDSLMNLLPIIGQHGWKPILFRENGAVIQTPSIWCAPTFSSITAMI